MKNAKEIMKITSEVSNKLDNENLRKIEQGIENNARKGLDYLTVDSISPNNCLKLESLGYKVTLGITTVNAYYYISWRENKKTIEN